MSPEEEIRRAACVAAGCIPPADHERELANARWGYVPIVIFTAIAAGLVGAVLGGHLGRTGQLDP